MSQVHESFYSFLNFEKFSTVKLPRKLQKNYIQSFQVKGHQRAPVADQGGHHQARRPGGAAQPLAAPPTLLGGSHAPWWHLSLTLSLFLSRNSSSCSVLVVLAVLEHGTLISLFSHLFELIFGTSTPWYVTPLPL